MNPLAVDEEFMRQAIQLAEKGKYSCDPNPRVGCIFTRNDEVIASGWHEKAGKNHAEINAIHSASEDLAGSNCYVTLEPCCHTGKTGPCTEALIKTGVSRVVIGMQDPNPLVSGTGMRHLTDAGIEVLSGVLEEQVIDQNRGFHSRMVYGRPFVSCKIAASQDWKVALRSGVMQWITGEMARQDVQELRARSSAIITGINTVLIDDPRLDVRDVDTLGRQPLRIILDREFRFPATAKMLSVGGDIIVIGHAGNEQAREKLQSVDVTTEVIEGDNPEFLTNVLKLLATKYEVNELMIEAGPTLSASFLEAELINELIIYQAPNALGKNEIDMLKSGDLDKVKSDYNFAVTEEKLFDSDMRITLTKSGDT